MVPNTTAARALRVGLNLTTPRSLWSRWLRDNCLFHFDTAGDITALVISHMHRY